jgi:hypothetical protein
LASFFMTFLSLEIVTSISKHVSFSLSCILMSGFWLVTVLSVYTYQFHNVVTLPSGLVSNDFWYMLIPVFFV